MFLLYLFLHIVNSCSVLFERQFVIVIQGHFLLMVLAPLINKSLHDFKLEIGRGESVIVLDSNMDDELTSESTYSHGLDISVWYFSFDSTEQIYE